VLASTDDPRSIDRMLEQTRTVVCSEQSVAALGPSLSVDAELIVSESHARARRPRAERDLLAR